MHKLAIDFGTTNSVVAEWDDAADRPSILSLPGLSTNTDGKPPLAPSLLYVNDGQAAQVTAGQAVRERGLDRQRDHRLFRNLKRSISASPTLTPRLIDGVQWNDQDAGRHFLRAVLDALPFPPVEIEQLVLTAPVAAFQGYLAWLGSIVGDLPLEKVRIVDESTAAALGYAVTAPGALVLVFDFGGGTLDLSLVRLPDSKGETGGVLRQFLEQMAGGGSDHRQATVIAKAGRNLGGSDVDQWLLADALRQANCSIDELGRDYAALLTLCEQAKIALSSGEAAELAFEIAGQPFRLTITRAALNAILHENGFFTALRRVIDKVMITARQQGIFKEDIHYVLMVGGMSLMPAVQETLKDYFDNHAVRAEKPFTAVAEGALQVALGHGVQDYLAHSYGLRHLDPATGCHQYDEIIPMGTAYPTEGPVEVILGAAHPNQAEIELIVGEIDADAVALIEVHYQDGQAVFVAQADRNAAEVMALNLERAALVSLNPAGDLAEDRIKAAFTVDERRQLRVTVTDLKTKKKLLREHVLATLR